MTGLSDEDMFQAYVWLKKLRINHQTPPPNYTVVQTSAILIGYTILVPLMSVGLTYQNQILNIVIKDLEEALDGYQP
jgi:hypothetical protein